MTSQHSHPSDLQATAVLSHSTVFGPHIISNQNSNAYIHKKTGSAAVQVIIVKTNIRKGGMIQESKKSKRRTETKTKQTHITSPSTCPHPVKQMSPNVNVPSPSHIYKREKTWAY
jgi:hypothetical protein